MAIDFPPAMAEFLEVWLGASVARGNEDLGFDSRLPYQDLAGDVRAYRAQAQRVLSWAKNALPSAIGEQFAVALGQFVSDGGADRLTELAQEAEKAADQQVEYSRRLAEAKYELIWEFVLMKIELAAIAVEVVFSGGAAAAQIPLVEARTALRMMLILTRLSRRVPLVSTTVTEAVEEALTSLGAQLTSMLAPDDPKRKRTSLDGKEIGVSAFFGAVAGAVGGALGQAVQGALKDVLKDKPQWFKEVLQVPEAFVNEGTAETVAEWFVKGVVYGKWDEFNPGTFVQAGISGALFEVAAGVTVDVTDFLAHKFNVGAVGAQHVNDASGFMGKFSAGDGAGKEKPSTVSAGSAVPAPGV
ncbi:hypothetical protein, partial [Streptomyces sp. NEAU-W12]|uniref:WXG100-like domain-containing protein n=1 Tax=Streptomyces sp. NEAU-W12 TaxID=2994668 RepID=UPI00224B9F53